MIAEYDVVIVGASIAGASLAYSLGNAGIKTALIDKKGFPRWKPCGEGLSNIATSHLKKLGLFETVLKSPHTLIPRYRIHIGPLKIPVSVVNFLNNRIRRSNIVGLDRSAFDFALVTKALSTKRVDFFDNQKITSDWIQNGRIHTSEGILNAKYVVLAAGNNHSFKEMFSFTEGRDRFGLSTHLTFSEPHGLNAVEIITKKHLQLFLTPISGTKLNLSALGSQKEIKALAQNQLVPAIEFVKNRLNLRDFLVSEVVGAGPFGRQANKRVSGNIILLGDAHESLDPIGGMGMTQGIISASTLGDTLFGILKKGENPDSALISWEARLSRKLYPLKVFTSLVRFLLDRIISFGWIGSSNFKNNSILQAPGMNLN
jgi:flavin-dependent dehydrogenase